MTWKEIGEQFGRTGDAVRIMAGRANMSKAEMFAFLTEQTKTEQTEQQMPINYKHSTKMRERTMRTFPPPKTTVMVGEQNEQTRVLGEVKSEQSEHFFTDYQSVTSKNEQSEATEQTRTHDLSPEQNANKANMESEHGSVESEQKSEHQSVTNDVTKELSQKVEELKARLEQPAAQAITFLRSDILAVTTMIVLSIMVALSFTARIFMDAGVTSLPAHIMAVLLDFSMILFVFRGHSQIAWMFGVNIFAQVALTTSAAFFLTFMSAAVLAGFKGVLVAGSIVLAVKGLSDYVNKK